MNPASIDSGSDAVLIGAVVGGVAALLMVLILIAITICIVLTVMNHRRRESSERLLS